MIMKRLYVFLFFSLFCFCNISADEICDDFLAEGKRLYNSGKYQEAKESFDYVKSKCGSYYGDVVNWIKKCDAALAPTLSVSKNLISCSADATTQYITVTSNTTWQMEHQMRNMFFVSKNGNTLTIRINANTSTTAREDYFNVKTTDGKIVKKITIKQSGKTTSNSSYSSNSSAKTGTSSTSATSTLSVSSTDIYSSYEGTTRTITVSGSKAWEVVYASGSMYSVTRSGNQLKVVIYKNSNNGTRNDYFKVKTVDGKEECKITLSQGANPYVKNSNSRNSNSNLTAYQKYIQNQDVFEVTWVGLNTSLCTGYSFGWSLFRLRFGWFQLKPYEMNAGYDFVAGSGFVTYNPSVNFLIPTGYDGTFYFGVGPTITTSEYFNGVWFNTELGYRYHWGDWASSDFFMRYDGAFTIGLSIQWSSYF